MIKFCTYLRRRFITLESSSNALLIVSDDFSIVNLRKKKKKEKKKGKESFAGKKFRNTIFRECDFTNILQRYRNLPLHALKFLNVLKTPRSIIHYRKLESEKCRLAGEKLELSFRRGWRIVGRGERGSLPNPSSLSRYESWDKYGRRYKVCSACKPWSSH